MATNQQVVQQRQGPLTTEMDGGLAAQILAAAGTLQQVKTGYATAVTVQKPRTLSLVERRLQEEANLAGETFYYGWGKGDNAVEGPSIKLAIAAARCWGNCAVEMEPIQETDDSWVLTAVFVDLETGFTLSRQFRQSKSWTVYGKFDDARKEDIRFQIGQSKAVRNVICNALPQWLIDKAMDQAKAGVRAKIEAGIKQHGLPATVDLALAAFLRAGVSEDRVLAKVGVAAKTAITTDHLVMLKGDLSAIQQGQERASDLFPEVSPGSSSDSSGGNGPGSGQTVQQDLEARLNAGASQAQPAQQQAPVQPEPSPVQQASTSEQKAFVKKATKKQIDRIENAARQLGLWEEYQVRLDEWRVAQSEELSEQQAIDLEKWLEDSKKRRGNNGGKQMFGNQ